MKPYFVTIHSGERDIHWLKLLAFGLLTILACTILIEFATYLAIKTLSLGALVVALVLASLIIARTVVRTVSYQEQEVDSPDLP